MPVGGSIVIDDKHFIEMTDRNSGWGIDARTHVCHLLSG